MERPLTGPQAKPEWNLFGAVRDFFGYSSLVSMFKEWRTLSPYDKNEIKVLLLRAGYNIKEDFYKTAQHEAALERALLNQALKGLDDGPNYEKEIEVLSAQQETDLLKIDGGYTLGDVHPTFLAKEAP